MTRAVGEVLFRSVVDTATRVIIQRYTEPEGKYCRTLIVVPGVPLNET